MRIRQQLRLTTSLFAVLAIAVLASVVVTNKIAKQAHKRETAANDAAEAASDLVYLSTDYLVNPDPQQGGRWEDRYNAFLSLVGNLRPANAQQSTIVHDIQMNAQRLKEVFESIRTTMQEQHQEDSQRF